MYWIALALVLSAPHVYLEVPGSGVAQLRGDATDRCAAARAIAEMPPCLDPASCQAVDAWVDLVGPPSPQLAPGPPGARVAPDAVGLRVGPDAPGAPPVPHPAGRLPWVCLAGRR